MKETVRSTLAPVVQRLQVALAPADAFDQFARCIASWWPFRRDPCLVEMALDVEFEPRIDGTITDVAPDGREGHGAGWTAMLERFARCAAGRAP
jgi:hypothetical protein